MTFKERYETTNCAICGSSDADSVYDGKGQFGFTTNVRVCKKCGFSFLSPRWDEQTYFSFYEGVYDKYYRNKPVAAAAEESRSSYYPIYKRYVDEFSVFGPENILDVGSGDGELLSYLIRQNPAANYYAIESSSSCRRGIEERGVNFVSNDVNSDWHRDFGGKFDFVIMRHVLEHFLDPVGVLKKIRGAMTDKGVLYIAVPDSYNYAPPLKSSYFRVVHTSYFTKDSLLNLLRISGFEAVRIVEADRGNRFQEMYAFATPSDVPVGNIDFSSDNYLKQKQIYEAGLKREESVSYKIAAGLKRLFSLAVRVKKAFFPKPVIRRKSEMLK